VTWNRTALVAALPVAAVAVIAGVVSYSHIAGLGLRTGQSTTDAHLLPLAVDGLIVAGSVVLLAEHQVCDEHGEEFATRHHLEIEPPPDRPSTHTCPAGNAEGTR
jgi:hypothetical protein